MLSLFLEAFFIGYVNNAWAKECCFLAVLRYTGLNKRQGG